MTAKAKKRAIIVTVGVCVLLAIGGFFIYTYVIDGMYGYENPVAFNYDYKSNSFDDQAFNNIVNAIDNSGIGYRLELATENGTACIALLIQEVNSEKAYEVLKENDLYSLYPDIVHLPVPARA